MEKKEICRNLPTLETNRLTLRKVSINDLEDMYEYASLDETSTHVTWNTHRSIKDTEQFLNMTLEQYEKNEGLFWGIVDKDSQKMIGTIYYVSWNSIHKVGELGYVISPHYWGKGLMTEAAKEVIRFGFEELGMVRIQARCFIQNVGSERVMQKSGMSYEGTMRKGLYGKGKHHDLKLYAIIKEDVLETDV
ncbi:GNAT family N-acetyltransferase [Pseudalkalibacillus berkeleyi]|uniref:GNAT family N-acetyltransferase n=1 Tax=Pseudalkalibacillus berkeleyi TaxID=1069813 RepID=A0ABS9H355_9BACL|nr:GNAT family protein [Pseudalkalibacillus berkeleyi]MCF6138288.1 GNAT family N-acetyltransferase [Pseudalkalibacillus berkeleyi]